MLFEMGEGDTQSLGERMANRQLNLVPRKVFASVGSALQRRGVSSFRPPSSASFPTVSPLAKGSPIPLKKTHVEGRLGGTYEYALQTGLIVDRG